MKRALKSKILVPFLILAIIFLLIFFESKSWLSWPKNLIYKISRPFLKSSQWLGDKISDTLSVVIILGDVLEENKYLQVENKSLFLENVQLKELALQNQILRQQLNLSSLERGDLLLANVIGRSPFGREYVFLIDRGSKDGLETGQSVVAGGGYLVGRIIEVASNLSKVLLITDSNSAVNVRIQETRASGVARGEHGISLIMEMISQEHNIKEGELVITSGTGGIFPKGLIVGQIEKVVSSETEVFKKVRLEPMVDFDKLEQVFIMK